MGWRAPRFRRPNFSRYRPNFNQFREKASKINFIRIGVVLAGLVAFVLFVIFVILPLFQVDEEEYDDSVATPTTPDTCVSGTGAAGDWTVCNAVMQGSSPCSLKLENDGNLVLYNPKGQSVWSTNSQNKGTGPYIHVMQPDGNFVIYDVNKKPVWASNTSGTGKPPPFRAAIGSDCNVTVTALKDNAVVWSSGTAGKNI